MCKPASMVLTKTKCYWSKRTNSHEEIIEEYGLSPDGKRGPNVVRIEIIPPGSDMTKPPSRWRFCVDQDVFPSWFSRAKYEPIVRKELRKWKKARVFTHGKHTVKDMWVYVYGSAEVLALGSSTVEAHGTSVVRAVDSSVVNAYALSKVRAFQDSNVIKYGGTVTLSGNARMIDRTDDKGE